MQTGVTAISSVRVESLRLSWLEAFIVVADRENISDAARTLGVDQSTVSRYIQALEKWLGKKLIEPGKVVDTQNARVSIGITTEGREFYIVAEEALKKLTASRNTSATGSKILREMETMVSSMEKDRVLQPPLLVTTSVLKNITVFRDLMSNLSEDHPVHILEVLRSEMKAFFNRYEKERNKEQRKSKRKPGISGANIKIP